MSDELSIYKVEFEERVVVNYIGDSPLYETHTFVNFVCAYSRGQAKSISLKEWDSSVGWTHPMSIRKVKHSIPADELSVGLLDYKYFANDDMVLYIRGEWYGGGYEDAIPATTFLLQEYPEEPIDYIPY